MAVGSKFHAPASFSHWNNPVTIAWEAGLAPGNIWMDAEKVAPIAIRSPDRPVRSKPLFRLSYCCPQCYIV
jgi:hypothetical protein